MPVSSDLARLVRLFACLQLPSSACTKSDQHHILKKRVREVLADWQQQQQWHCTVIDAMLRHVLQVFSPLSRFSKEHW